MRIYKTALAAMSGLSILSGCGQRSEAEQARSQEQAALATAEDAAAAAAGHGNRTEREQISGPALPPELARILAGAQSSDYRLSTSLSSSLTVAGIPTGGLLADAVVIAMRHQPAFRQKVSAQRLSINDLPSGVNLRRNVFLSSPRESILIEAAGLPGQERVFAVHRYVAIPDQPVSLSGFRSELERRFGSYVLESRHSATRAYHLSWGWLSDGTPVPPSGIGQPGFLTTNQGGTSYRWYLADCGGLPRRAGMSPDAYEFQGASWPSRCGVQVAAKWDYGDDRELVSQYMTTLYDPDTIAKVAGQIQTRLSARAEAQQAAARQAASGRQASF